MADNQTAPATTATPKIKTVLDDMDARRIFDTKESAAAYILEAMTLYTDLGNYPVVSPVDAKREGGAIAGLGQDDDGNFVFDSEIFPDDMRIMVAVLTTRGEGVGSSKVKAIVVAPIPTLAATLADAAGKAWLESRLDTEYNRAAVRVLRDTKDSTTDLSDITVLDQMPRSLSDYVTSSRVGTSTLLEAFEEFWKSIKTALGKLSKSWKLANLPKREFKNAMSSAAYASQYYPTLEDSALGAGKRGSLFVIALGAFKAEASKNGKDSTIFDQWLNTRDEYIIKEGDEDSDEDGDDEELSMDALIAAMASPAVTETAPVETPVEATPESSEVAEEAAPVTGEEAPATEEAPAE